MSKKTVCVNCRGEKRQCVFDWVPYGSTYVQIQSGDQCTHCGWEEIIDVCVECEKENCECEETK